MSFDPDALSEAVARHGRVARVVVAEVKGSAPREPGASMLVWAEGQEGTIGGGALEWEAAATARAALAAGAGRLDRLPLGPALGQCCGGAVLLLTEIWDRARLAGLGGVAARPLPGVTGGMPLAVARRLAAARNGSGRIIPGVVQGWMVEPLTEPRLPLWIWGAGHVGRAIAGLMAPLPGWAVTWADTARDRFPAAIPEGIAPLVAPDLPAAVREAPQEARHLILTYSHAIDLALCHALLGHGFLWAGLIGSDTKRARFRSRLKALGHGEAEIARICCPIGRKSFGKHPQAIAIGVAADLISAATTRRAGLNPAAAKGATG